jgi:hypothetical protein
MVSKTVAEIYIMRAWVKSSVVILQLLNTSDIVFSYGADEMASIRVGAAAIHAA